MKKSKSFIGILFVLGVLIIAGCSTSPTGNVVKNIATQSGEVKEFNVKAFRFGYDPNVISVNKGDRVKIVIDNADGLHGIRIPELGVSGNNVVEFTADKEGEFTWYCNRMCGSGHGSMSGTITVN